MKACKNCQKEFFEFENFTWSCETHTSEYGGEMWWFLENKAKKLQDANNNNTKVKMKNVKILTNPKRLRMRKFYFRDTNVPTVKQMDKKLLIVQKILILEMPLLLIRLTSKKELKNLTNIRNNIKPSFKK